MPTNAEKELQVAESLLKVQTARTALTECYADSLTHLSSRAFRTAQNALDREWDRLAQDAQFLARGGEYSSC